MATKDNLLLRNSKVSSSNQSSQLQYSNLNLNNLPGGYQRDTNIFNGNQRDGFMITSKSFAGKNDEYGNKQHEAFRSGSHQVQELIEKWETRISSNDFGNKKSKKVISGQSNSSTLSLHIAAYENAIQDQKRDDDVGGRKKSKYSSFEIPRQQKDDPKKPEIMQFKSSQKLANPTSTQQGATKKDSDEAEEPKKEVDQEKKASQKLANPNAQQQQPTSNGQQQLSKDVKQQPQKKTKDNDDDLNDVILYSLEEKKKILEAKKDAKKIQVAAEVKKLDELPGPLQTEKSRYEFLNKIGRGSTGIVYRVKNEKGQLFALKECNNISEIYSDLQICKLAESCLSSHFTKVEAAGSYGKKYYGIFELVGPNLDEIAENATKSKILCLAKQSLQCIEQLHAMGFIHCDISGTNLAVGQIGTAKEETVYLIDFDQSELINKKREEDQFKDFNYQRDDLAKWLEIFLGYLGVPMDVECGLRDSEEFKNENLKRIKHLDGFPFIYLHIRNFKPENGKYNYELIYKILDYALELLGEPKPLNDGNTDLFDIKKINMKFKPAYYKKSRQQHFLLNHEGDKYYLESPPKTVIPGQITVFRCDCWKNGCRRKIQVLNYAKENIQDGDIAEISKILNQHSCKPSKASSTTVYDLSIFN